MSLRSPLGKALGQGAAGGGAQHFWVQRASAVALVPLTLWFVLTVLGLPSLDFASLRSWVGVGFTPVLLILLLLAAACHSQLGVQVVIEDYVHGKAIKAAALLASSCAHIFVAVAGVYAIVKIALAGL